MKPPPPPWTHWLMQLGLFAVAVCLHVAGRLSPQLGELALVAMGSVGLGHAVQAFQAGTSGKLVNAVTPPLVDLIQTHIPKTLTGIEAKLGAYLDACLDISASSRPAPDPAPLAPAPGASAARAGAAPGGA